MEMGKPSTIAITPAHSITSVEAPVRSLTAIPSAKIARRLSPTIAPPRNPFQVASIFALIFDDAERGADDELRMQFEAISKYDAEEKKTAKEVLDGLILRHEARRCTSSA
jgi:hypothetical protein